MSVPSRSLLAALLLALGLVQLPTTVAAPLDAEVDSDPFLSGLALALDAAGIDVIANLNHRQLARGRIERPRLGRFPDLPSGFYPGTEQILLWEEAFADGDIAALALLRIEDHDGLDDRDYFLQRWLSARDEDRVLITYHSSDRLSAEAIAAAAAARGYRSLQPDLVADNSRSLAGELFATAAQRLAVDSEKARRSRLEVAEMAYLGERVRRKQNSLFREDGNRGEGALARSEPAVFLKETLGDEFSDSTIHEIIVPGGVALGETAYLSEQVSEVRYSADRLWLVNEGGKRWRLPPLDPPALKALFDFTQRSQAIGSDAIVDIDGDGRVSISSALRDTDAGYSIMHADTQPFTYVDYLRVIKSVMIDVVVDWYTQPGTQDQLTYSTGYEIRFLAADNMRLAQTEVALEYEYDAYSGNAEFVRTWGDQARRLRENLDYTGLGTSTLEVARLGGWIGLFRRLHEEQTRFVQGRYEFMKIDKAGRETPYRY